jgi:hypothetical protein
MIRRAVVLAACLTIAGCTDGGNGRLTGEEFISQADAICASANARVAALVNPKTLADLAVLSRKALAISSDQLERLRALRPPEELEPELDRMYGLTEEQNDLVGRIGDAAEAGDEKAIEKLVAKADPLEKESDRITQNIGLRECGLQDD